MYKVFVVTLREFKAAVLSKAFIISVAIMPVLMGGSIAVQAVLRNKTGPEEKKYAIIDRTGKLFRHLHRAAQKRNTYDVIDPETGERTDVLFQLEEIKPEVDVQKQRIALSERVRKGEFQGFIDIGKDVMAPLSKEEATLLRKLRFKARGAGSLSYGTELGDNKIIRYFTTNTISTEFSTWAMTRLNSQIQIRRTFPNITDDDIAHQEAQAADLLAQMTEVPMVSSEPLDNTGATPKEVNTIATVLLPIVVVMLMFMLVMIGASPLMQGVVEEKSLRIAEVLLASVRPFELMMGKLLGTVAVSMVLMLVYLGGGYWTAIHFGYGQYIQPTLLAWFVVFQIMAVLMYGALFIGVGAACSDIKETQALLMPVMLIICVPLFVLRNVITEPDSNFATVMSLIPPATPMLMIARLSVYEGIPWWQPALGVVLVLITTVLMVYAASRVFRVGLLAQGKGASYLQIIKWVFKG